MANRDVDREITVLQDEIKKLESSIRQTESMIHSTPRPQAQSLPDSGIVTGQRPSTWTSDSPVANYLRVNEPQSSVQFRLDPERHRRTGPQFGDMLGLSNIGPSSANGQYITERRPRRIIDNERGHSESRGYKSRREVKPATYDGSGPWIDYYTHFRTVSKLNEWTEDENGLFLAASLRGQAQSVLGDLPGDSNDYRYLVQALEERFAPPNQTELYRVQLRDRRKRATETIPELGQSVRRLTNLAYPRAPTEVKETLAMEQFLDALPDSDMRIRIKQARPQNLNDATRHAVELEAYLKAENKHSTMGHQRQVIEQEGQGHSTIDKDLRNWMEKMEKNIGTLSKEIEFLSKSSIPKSEFREKVNETPFKRRRKLEEIECYACHKKGHYQKNCPENTKSIGETHGSTKRENSSNFQKAKSNQMTGRLGSCTGESGMFVNVAINDIQTKFLIDTGATVSMLSKQLYDKIKDHSCYEIKETKMKVFTADGTQMELQGKLDLQIELGTKRIELTALISDIQPDGILGLDIIRSHEMMISAKHQTLTFDDVEIPILFEGTLGCFRIVAQETFSIPPRSERVVPGKLCTQEGRDVPKEGIVEPGITTRDQSRPLTARTLVHPYQSSIVPVRLLNITPEPKVVYKNTEIGQYQETNVVDCPMNQSTSVDWKERQDLQDLEEESAKNLNKDQTELVRKFIQKYQYVFAKSNKELGKTTLVKHKIDTGNSRPVKQSVRRAPAHLSEEIDRNITEMLEHNIIEPSVSAWASPIILVKKKDNTYRFCVDYRRLNACTVKDAYPLPKIDESLDQLSGYSWFSTLDMFSGYWQVELDPEDKHKTAFTTRRGLFQFKVMPFGLCCAPATFERLMESVLAGLNWDICLVYLDDIIIMGKSFEDMLHNLTKVFDRFQHAGLRLKAKKCHLFQRTVTFLGHVISEEGISTDPEKVKSIRDWPVPNNAHEVRSFLGLCGYYRKFIENFAKTAKCLHRLTEKGRNFVWNTECHDAFQKLKEKLTSAPVLGHPDFAKEFILDTDASQDAIGAILSQVQDGHEKVIAYASRTMSKCERNYCVTRKELLAVVHFVKIFRHFLEGRKFRVRTDHSSLKWLLRFKHPEGQLARWIEILNTYDMQIEHRPGIQHKNADALSRIPCRQCGFSSNWEDQEQRDVNMLTNEQLPDLSSLKKLQEKDTDIAFVIKHLKDGSKPKADNMAGKSTFLRNLVGQWDRLVLRDDMVFREWDSGRDGPIYQALVPLSERRNVLYFCHDFKGAGHLGYKKTLEKVKSKYFWPGCRKDVRGYVMGCNQCSKRKNPNKSKRAPMGIVETGVPMERIATDILGELPRTNAGNRYILVVSDYFTKWTESFAMPNMEAQTVAKILVEEVIARFGVPNQIHSDQGRQYESQLFQELCQLLRIQKTRTTPYHPQSDGMVERFNKTLATMLSTYVNEFHSDWDEYLPYVMQAYRSAVHETTGYTPNFLMLGREVSTPLDLMYELPYQAKVVPRNEWVWILQEKMEEAHKIVRNSVKQAMGRQKIYHDRKLAFEKFKAGDQVFVYFPVRKPGRSSKLTSFWHGPFQILNKCSDLTYRVNCGSRGKEQVVHVDRLRKKHPQILSGEVSNDLLDNDKIVEDLLPEVQVERGIQDEGLELEHRENENMAAKRSRRPPKWMSDYTI